MPNGNLLLAMAIKERKLRLARDDFWEFCCLVSPDFYNDSRPHLKLLCRTLQSIKSGDLKDASGKPYKKLALNIPPRHGKSRTLINFCLWCLGREPKGSVITVSYNNVLAGEFARYTRDGLIAVARNPLETVFSDVFPGVKIKKGNSSAQKWALDGSHFTYSGVGMDSSLTGMGAKTIACLDDPIKNAAEAFNENELDRHWAWYTGTFLSRLEKDCIQILCMTRWVKGDLTGRLLEKQPEDWYVLNLPAIDEDGKMLCPNILSLEGYKELERSMDPLIFEANYNCRCIDSFLALYQPITWDPLTLPPTWEKKVCMVDVATSGKDYLCAIAFGVSNKQAFILDVLHTQEDTEVSEDLLVNLLIKNGIRECHIESNSAGGLFAKNIKRKLALLKAWSVRVSTFYQGQNKQTRILTASSIVNTVVYFPPLWKDSYKSFWRHVFYYKREGKNQPDDAADCLSLIAEYISKPRIRGKVRI
jgi:predicted phage terminase large subunit-like protein